MFDRIYQAYASRVATLSMFQKLAIKTLLIAVIPLLLTTVLFLRQANLIIAQETRVSNERAFLQTVARLDSDLQMNKSALSTFVSMPRVINILSESPEGRSDFEQAMDLRDLINDAMIIGLTDTVFRLRIYVRDYYFFSRERIYTYPLSEIQDEPWYADINRYPFVYLPLQERFYYYNQTREVVSFASGIRLYQQSNDIIGVAMVDLELDKLRNLLQGESMGTGSVLALVDKQSLMVVMGNEPEAVEADVNAPFTEDFLDKLAGHINSQASGVILDGWYVQWSPLAIPDWQLMEAIPMERMEAGRRQLLIQIGLLVPAVIALVIIFTLLTTRAFTGRIRNMALAVNRFEHGERDVRLTIGSGDVLGRFEQDLNLLFDRVNRLVAEQYALGQQAKNADMNALQSQINPHFLYNTLDMLYWMAKQGDDQRLPEVIVALSSFYRKSLSRGREVVQVTDELEHVRLYLEIQNCRFGETIDVAWDVDDDLTRAALMKLTLQPIVENAVQHGVGRSRGTKSRIEIAVRRDGDDLLIAIADNGAGMSAEQAQSLTKGDLMPQKATGSSYGIHNVQRRLRLLYGEAYGLTYESKLGQGTTVLVRVPLKGDAISR